MTSVGPDAHRRGAPLGRSARVRYSIVALVIAFLVGVLAGRRFLPATVFDALSLVFGVPIIIVLISALLVMSGRAVSEGFHDGLRLLVLWRGRGR